MKLLTALLVALLAPSAALAQSASDKLPPTNPLPYADDEAGPVLMVANAFLKTLSSDDPRTLLAFVRPEGGATATIDRPAGKVVRHMSWAEFVENLKADGHRYEERLTDPIVELDGDIAMIWSPYVFLIDGKLVHCGVDHFDLVRENGAWKVLNVTWTQRATGCPAQ